MIRRLLRRRANTESFRFGRKELRSFVAIAIGFALIFIDIFLVSDGGALKGVGAAILIWSAIEFLG
jgi:membrane-bound ClpP family serine protease